MSDKVYGAVRGHGQMRQEADELLHVGACHLISGEDVGGGSDTDHLRLEVPGAFQQRIVECRRLHDPTLRRGGQYGVLADK